MSLLAVVLGALFAAANTPLVSASFSGNLNYASPSRRDIHAGLGIDVPLVSRRSLKRDAVPLKPEELSFTHGVTSGDPHPNSVILWTRVAPSDESDASNITVTGNVPLFNHDTQTYIAATPYPICVEWAVFEYNPDSANVQHYPAVVSRGTAYTTSDIDYTVKVEAGGLEPFTMYSYQFTICGSEVKSPLGRTKTAPAADEVVDQIKFAVFSCSNYPQGYFNAYGNAARKDEHDYVVHLGDYIYEHGNEGERATKPLHELLSLHDYRTRHGQYRSDPDLQLLSKNFAWITTWDDHEVADNGYRDGSAEMNNTEDTFIRIGHNVTFDQRKMNAVRAYFEWMPIRQVDLDDNLRIWRSFQMGNLLDFIVLDTRYYDRSITDLYWNTEYIAAIRNDASRSLMGSHQEHWFYNTLSQSNARKATWRVVADQVIFSHIVESYGLNGDNWNGYIANRNRTLKHLYDNNIGNNIFLAGDSHQNWVADLAWEGEKPYNLETGEGAIGVEFAGTAVSSTGVQGTIEYARQEANYRIGNNTVLQWNDGYYRGYFILTASHDQVEAQYFGSPSVASRNSWDLPLANFTVLSGSNKVSRPLAGGSVEAGCGRGIETKPTNVSLNTDTQEWSVVGYDVMYLNATRVKSSE